jgi:hypothetical protein
MFLGFRSRLSASSLGLALLAGCSAPVPPVMPETPPAPAAVAAAPVTTSNAAPEAQVPAPAVAAPLMLAGQASFRGDALAKAEVKLVDAVTGAAMAGTRQVTDAEGRFAVPVPAGATWVRVLVTVGPSTLSSLTEVQAGQRVLAAGDVKVDEVSTAMAQMSLGAFVLFSYLPADQAEQARRRHLERLAQHREGLVQAFKREPGLANAVAAASDATSGLPKNQGAVEQAAQAAGAAETLRQATQEGIRAVADAFAASAAASGPADAPALHLGANLTGTIRDGQLSLVGGRGQVITFAPGAAPAGLDQIRNGTFFNRPSRSRRSAPARVLPADGRPGATVTLAGSGFDTDTLTNNVVTFNGVPAVVTAATSTQLTVTAPDRATSGAVVTTVGGRSTTVGSFEYLSPRIQAGTTYYDSIYRYGDIFAEGAWTNSRGGFAWAQRDFDGTYLVDEITVVDAFSDLNHGVCATIDFSLQKPDGTWVRVDRLTNANIAANGGGTHNGYRLVLDTPVAAMSFRLNMVGNGWFEGRDVRLYGHSTTSTLN